MCLWQMVSPIRPTGLCSSLSWPKSWRSTGPRPLSSRVVRSFSLGSGLRMKGCSSTMTNSCMCFHTLLGRLSTSDSNNVIHNPVLCSRIGLPFVHRAFWPLDLTTSLCANAPPRELPCTENCIQRFPVDLAFTHVFTFVQLFINCMTLGI